MTDGTNPFLEGDRKHGGSQSILRQRFSPTLACIMFDQSSRAYGKLFEVFRIYRYDYW